MDKNALLDRLIAILCEERKETPPALAPEEKADFFRALCNVRPPRPVTEEFLRLQDEYLSARKEERGVVEADSLPYRDGIALWRGDITRLRADAIVNACNAALLGCFGPLHACIDNAIHSAAGVQVRLDCQAMMQGRQEPNGRVRVTRGYNLPARYIFHTVGPIVHGNVTKKDERDLKNCYLSCLEKAKEMKLSSIAFCCISTGEYGYPQAEACHLAVETVRSWLEEQARPPRVIFDVFLEEDERLYERELAKTAE